MKGFMKCMVVLLAVLFSTGMAFAWNNADHAKVAPNGKGDLLFFPYYVVADGGWETKISVTNTEAITVVAKVVIRSMVNSTELLDFLIYLSPRDVWTGYLRWDGSRTIIYSEDDSVRTASGTWASSTNPLSYALKTIGEAGVCNFCANDTTQTGYVYVVMSGYCNATVGTVDFTDPPVDKQDIYDEYEKAATAFTFQTAAAPFNAWFNPLTGYSVFTNATSGLYSSAVRATAISDWQSTKKLNQTATDRLNSFGHNTLAELEAALCKTNIALPYVENTDAATVHVFTFPTKYTRTTNCDDYAFDSPFFTANLIVAPATTTKTPTLTFDTVSIWDTSEHTTATTPFSPSPVAGAVPFRNEVNLVVVDDLNEDNFEEGWVRYADTGFTAVPAATATASGGTILYNTPAVLANAVFFGTSDSFAVSGGWDDGLVAPAGVLYPYYQYRE